MVLSAPLEWQTALFMKLSRVGGASALSPLHPFPRRMYLSQ